MFEKIILSRSICYGDCPEFEVIVKKDGTAKWFGGMFVHRAGEVEFQLDNRKLQQLGELLQSFDFRHFTYPAATIFATDLPYCTIKVSYQDGVEKEVEHYLGGDFAEEGSEDNQSFQELEQFEKRIEKVIGLQKFIGASTYNEATE
ncbi:hypothetical protein JCM21714_3205 [Gracilibacillus boraciitolerans JCM 21714]|uniref:DUF6438 domain-containing protein n=1 Tax=Gracilibacillus boraciitolerans JCM 21714 TaxID=1298598 RepID=W4VMK4_9BACI|nr:DUF6438 domain-containing protein [Gracilibacillus boraciitolerans]GAE94073.1 hypothetical protein JCM21714_3205 [Gracilibacillus boraciitolerans JCM 21714]